MQPLAVDLHELAARRHRGFDLPRGVGGEPNQTRNDDGNDQNQRQYDAHERRPNAYPVTLQYDTRASRSSTAMNFCIIADLRPAAHGKGCGTLSAPGE